MAEQWSSKLSVLVQVRLSPIPQVDTTIFSLTINSLIHACVLLFWIVWVYLLFPFIARIKI
jgi:hypothetical protein